MTTSPEDRQAYPQDADEISLGELFQTLWLGKWWIGGISVLAAAIATVVALNMPVYYRADVLISPASSDSAGGGLSALAGQFGGLAALAGVNVGGGDGKKGESLATLSSRALTENYIQRENLMPILFADQWDEDRKDWKASVKKKPTLWDGVKAFNKKIRTVAQDKKTGLVTITIEWRDPKLAAQWANDLVKLTNQILRQGTIANSTRNLDYLNQQLDKTSAVELRQSIYRLIETEVKNVMLAQGSEEFAFKVIDPAVMPEEKSKPKRAQIVLGALMLALIASSLGVLLFSNSKRATALKEPRG